MEAVTFSIRVLAALGIQAVLLTNGAVFERRVLIDQAGEPLKITLAYTDEPGLPTRLTAHPKPHPRPNPQFHRTPYANRV